MFHYDGLGWTVALTNAAGAVLESYHYDAFGRRTIYNGSGSVIAATAYGNRFMFAGREYLAELNLYDSRNRFYSPELGRFLQADPLRFGGGDSNIYRYVGNDPTSATDPMGLYWKEWGIAIGGYVGGTIALIGSVGADAATGGLNVPATPAEVGAGASVGALVGGAIGTWLDANSSTSSGDPNGQAISAPATSNTGWRDPSDSDYPAPTPPGDPTQSPGEGWEWRGNGEPGSSEGSWYNPDTDESLHPDLEHDEPKGPHWDWTDPDGNTYDLPPTECDG